MRRCGTAPLRFPHHRCDQQRLEKTASCRPMLCGRCCCGVREPVTGKGPWQSYGRCRCRRIPVKLWAVRMPLCWAFVVTSWPKGQNGRRPWCWWKWRRVGGWLRMWCCGAVFCLLVEGGCMAYGTGNNEWGLQKRVAKRCHILQHCNEACDGRWQWTLEILEQMKLAQVQVDTFTMNSLLSATVQGGQWRLAMQVLEEMDESGVGADIITFNTLLNAAWHKRLLSLGHALPLKQGCHWKTWVNTLVN